MIAMNQIARRNRTALTRLPRRLSKFNAAASLVAVKSRS